MCTRLKLQTSEQQFIHKNKINFRIFLKGYLNSWLIDGIDDKQLLNMTCSTKEGRPPRRRRL